MFFPFLDILVVSTAFTQTHTELSNEKMRCQNRKKMAEISILKSYRITIIITTTKKSIL